jgi:hypothetical protein
VLGFRWFRGRFAAVKIGRKTPYTQIGISRIKCSKIGCNKAGRFQWQCCALDNRWFALCTEHDIGLNAVACQYILGDESKPFVAAYKKRVLDPAK